MLHWLKHKFPSRESLVKLFEVLSDGLPYVVISYAGFVLVNSAISTVVLMVTCAIWIISIFKRSELIRNLVLSLSKMVLSLIKILSISLRQSNSPIERVPCAQLDLILKFLFSKRAYERVFSQLIDDFRFDYVELISERRVWKARWLVVCTYITTLLTVASYLSTAVVKRIKGIWSAI